MRTEMKESIKSKQNSVKHLIIYEVLSEDLIENTTREGHVKLN